MSVWAIQVKFCRFEQIRDNFVPHRNTIQNTMTMLLDLNCSRGDPLMELAEKNEPKGRHLQVLCWWKWIKLTLRRLRWCIFRITTTKLSGMWKYTIPEKHSWSLANPSKLSTAVALSITLYLNRLVCQRSVAVRDLLGSVINEEYEGKVSLIKIRDLFLETLIQAARKIFFQYAGK